MINYFLLSLLLSLFILGIIGSSNLAVIAIPVFIIGVFSLYQIRKLFFYSASSEVSTSKVQRHNQAEIYANLLAQSPATLSTDLKLARISYLFQLAQPEKGSESEIIFALNCLLEMFPGRNLLFFEFKEGQFKYVAGIRENKRRGYEKIPAADEICSETLKRVKALLDTKSLLRNECRYPDFFTVTDTSGPQVSLIPISLFGKFRGMLSVISAEELAVSLDDKTVLQFFAEQFAIYLDSQERWNSHNKKEISASKNFLCREITGRILPSQQPVIAGWEIAFNAHICPEYCGDFYDFLPMPGGSLMVMIGKASGGGIKAAIFFTRLQATTRSLLQQNLNPAELLNKVSQQIAGDEDQELFSTLQALKIKPNSHEVIFACAGHALPLINRTRNGYAEIVSGESGIPLGLFDTGQYQNQSIQMLPGDGLFIYTDGILENPRRAGKQFDVEKLKLKLEQLPEQSAAEMLKQLINEVFSPAKDSSSLSEDHTGIYLKVE